MSSISFLIFSASLAVIFLGSADVFFPSLPPSALVSLSDFPSSDLLPFGFASVSDVPSAFLESEPEPLSELSVLLPLEEELLPSLVSFLSDPDLPVEESEASWLAESFFSEDVSPFLPLSSSEPLSLFSSVFLSERIRMVSEPLIEPPAPLPCLPLPDLDWLSDEPDSSDSSEPSEPEPDPSPRWPSLSLFSPEGPLDCIWSLIASLTFSICSFRTGYMAIISLLILAILVVGTRLEIHSLMIPFSVLKNGTMSSGTLVNS